MWFVVTSNQGRISILTLAPSLSDIPGVVDRKVVTHFETLGVGVSVYM